jgi:hypothetical protein
MLSVAQTMADGFVTDEVCPLCLDHYAAVDECTCVVCDAPSCPGCAELLDPGGAMRCYACAPVSRHTESGVHALNAPPFIPARPHAAANMQATRLQKALRATYRSLSALYSSGLRSLKKPIEALSLRIVAKSKSAVITASAERSSSLNLLPR